MTSDLTFFRFPMENVRLRAHWALADAFRSPDRIVALDGQAVVRPMLHLSVSFDHRVVDGARGAEFLDTLASLIEEPAGLVG